MKHLIEHALTQEGHKLSVDRESGVISGVKILGQVSRNGNYYTEKALSDASGLYEGVAVYDGHGTRKYSDHVGDVRGGYVRGNAVYGDLHLRKHHNLYESILDDAENKPGNLALSHEVMDGNYVGEHDGEYLQVQGISKVDAVAIVKHGGTNVSLVEEEMATTPKEIKTLDGLREAYPDLIEQLQESIASERKDSEKMAEVIMERDAAIAGRDELQGKLDLIEQEREAEELKSSILAEAKELGIKEDGIAEDLMEEFMGGMKRETVTNFLKKLAPAEPEKQAPAGPESTPGHRSGDEESNLPFYARK